MSPAPSTPSFDCAVLIGRFQPFHSGHAGLLQAALASAAQVVVVLGSAFHARSPKNPFTWQERAAMIATSLPEAQRARVHYVAVRDYYDDGLWADSVRRKVADAVPASRVALVACFKDATSYYLHHFPQWTMLNQEIDAGAPIGATAIRKVLFEAEDVDVSLGALAQLLPKTIAQYLKAWTMLPWYAPLVQEHRAIEAYKTRWRTAPYAPIFCTVDALVQTGGHVLLVKRGGYPGKDLWALPGGFLEPRERLLQGAIRELAEETQLGVLAPTLEEALVGVAVFDHPDRSQRGRTITHAHHFNLQTSQLPEVSAADDAALAQWLPLAALPAMEEQFFEDHFHILNHFLKLTHEQR